MDRHFTQEQGRTGDASAPVGDLSPEALIALQRKTVADHIQYEQTKNWPEVYRTFTPHHEDSYYDVVAFQTRFQKMKGIVDFYEAFTRSFPDFQIALHAQHDTLGVSIIEVQITATHQGEYCGIPATGRRVSVAFMAFFLFDKATGHLNGERLYFDNNTILSQIRGQMSPDVVFDLRRMEHDATAQ